MSSAKRPPTPDDPIPTYAESSQYPPLLPPQPPSSSSSQAANTIDAPPPPYASLPPSTTPPAPTTFSLTPTTPFIHALSGPPLYHISPSLLTRTPTFRLRRLRPRDISHPDPHLLPFDRSDTLYEVSRTPGVSDEVQMRGLRRGCVQGVVWMKFGVRNWRVRHVVGRSGRGVEVLKVRRGKGTGRGEGEGEWRDKEGRVVAREVVREGVGGEVVMTVEVLPELDQVWRELVVCLWAARLWIACGEEKTAALG
ncbi:hypothetical protein EJ04DRAFT_582095 [Polyplosphaeria fusca]|uniref:Uncharacterized protein n=1 Tax=Polyplosphaeria fusca TaxID=682080 RepID=A0A9P4UWN0_9PLEO|nr:hypothetical protein EJ04DRAFT_582095 [Polyplosphaeria fusca]